jgi:hypothetical protein
MKTIQKSLAGLFALAALLGLDVSNADAGVRVGVVVRTPVVRVHIGNTTSARYLYDARAHFPVRARAYYKISKTDLLIARRLARFTGVEARELTRLRGWGYTWAEIGRWLRLPARTMRAAMNEQSWKRFLRDQRRLAANRDHRHGHREYPVAYFDNGRHDDH